METVGDLKREKATKKTAFTTVRRYLLTVIQREDVNSQEIKDACDELARYCFRECYECNG